MVSVVQNQSAIVQNLVQKYSTYVSSTKRTVTFVRRLPLVFVSHFSSCDHSSIIYFISLIANNIKRHSFTLSHNNQAPTIPVYLCTKTVSL